jgi:hypothetical protein
MKIKHLASLALVALALAFVVAGCGGSDESSADSATETESTESVAEDTESTSTETTVGAVGDLSEECLSLASSGAKFSEAFEAASNAGAEGDLSQYTEAFDEYAKEAPEEIRDDLETIGENIGKYAEAIKDLDLSGGGVPSADQLQKLQQLASDFNGSDMQKASANVQAWVTANCSNG